MLTKNSVYCHDALQGFDCIVSDACVMVCLIYKGELMQET